MKHHSLPLCSGGSVASLTHMTRKVPRPPASISKLSFSIRGGVGEQSAEGRVSAQLEIDRNLSEATIFAMCARRLLWRKLAQTFVPEACVVCHLVCYVHGVRLTRAHVHTLHETSMLETRGVYDLAQLGQNG